MKVASGTSRCALPSAIPRRTPSARAPGSASMTVPGLHGRPPSTSGPGVGRARSVGPAPGGVAGAAGTGAAVAWSDLAIGGLVMRGAWSINRASRGETRVPLAALGVEDPERRSTPRRAVAVVGHERLGPLADDVAARAGPTTGAPARAGYRSTRRPRSRGHRRVRARRGSAAGSRRAARARPVDAAGRRRVPACRSGPVDHRAGRGRAGRPTDRPAGSRRC